MLALFFCAVTSKVAGMKLSSIEHPHELALAVAQEWARANAFQAQAADFGSQAGRVYVAAVEAVNAAAAPQLVRVETPPDSLLPASPRSRRPEGLRPADSPDVSGVGQ